MADNNIFDTPLDFLIGDRFGKYAKYIIQDRALPDVRDGLKPVQRRIIYAMMVNGNLPNKQYKKSATAVGFVIGHYHPHGDGSVYDAMVRMSQSWKQNEPLIDMQGNNGSIDDDPAAAMRYTEAKLSLPAMELLKDIDKDTVEFAPNYDDSTFEPTVLPSKFPNLLVNGAEGIAAGYSTSIPPHNLNEVVNATIYRIKNPNCTLDELIEIVQGPDFPTGGFIRGKEGLRECLENGYGQIQLESKYEIVENKSYNAIIISEIPFGVVKKQLVYSIDKIRMDKEIDGISEVRDESDKNGLRIVIEIKKEADINAILSYLMKKTKLSISYTYNVIAICNKKPQRLGIISILDHYIKHQIEVINRRTKYELNKVNERLHIVEGLVKAISNIDELIQIVRTSISKENIKERLCNRFDIDLDQAEAIVTIQLHRLNSVDVNDLVKEAEDLKNKSKELASIIDNERKIKNIIVKELEEINHKYKTPRLSIIKENKKEYVIDKKPIIKEDVMVSVTRDAYFKRSSLKSYNASDNSYPGAKNTDLILGVSKLNTEDNLLAFSDKGNYIFVPVYEIFENKWKEEGKHISSIISLSGDEKILKVINVKDFSKDAYIVIATANGFIKKTRLEEFLATKYNKPILDIKLNKDDKVVGVDVSDGDSIICVFSKHGKVVQYHESKVSPIGLRSLGVKSMNLDKDDCVNGLVVLNKNDKSNILVLTNKGMLKAYNPNQVTINQRLTKPTEIYKYYRTEPQYLVDAIKLNNTEKLLLLTNFGTNEISLEDIKVTPVGKNIRNTIFEDKNCELIKSSTLEIKTIDDNFKTYKLDNKNIEKVIAEKVFEKEKTIFDYLDELDNND